MTRLPCRVVRESIAYRFVPGVEGPRSPSLPPIGLPEVPMSLKPADPPRTFEEWFDEELAQERLRRQCLLCGSLETEQHHIQYRPTQRVVYLCKSCHRSVHRTPGYHDELEPEQEFKSLSAEDRREIGREERRGEIEIIRNIDDVEAK